MTYDQARKDHEYLWAHGPADDITGAYVDQDDLAHLLKSPTKNTARECYERQIVYWFQTGPDTSDDLWKNDSEVHQIAERYSCEDEYARLRS